MIGRYIKDLAYYFFEFVGSLVNFTCSFVGVYPKLELGIQFLYTLENRRFTKETDEQTVRRSTLHKDADDKFSEAKEIV